MRLEEDLKLDYKDVLIRPKRSTLVSRSQVKLNRKFQFRNYDHNIAEPTPDEAKTQPDKSKFWTGGNFKKDYLEGEELEGLEGKE